MESPLLIILNDKKVRPVAEINKGSTLDKFFEGKNKVLQKISDVFQSVGGNYADVFHRKFLVASDIKIK